jgi:hypothetical protein
MSSALARILVPVWTLGDRVPDSQAIRWQVEAVGTRQGIFLGKRVGERRNWLFEQKEDRPVGSVPKWLWQRFNFVPGPVVETEDPVTH